MNIFDKSFLGQYKSLILYFDYNLLIPFLKNNDTNFTIDNYSTNIDFTEQDLSIQDQENIYKSLINYCCNKLNIEFSDNFIYGIFPSFHEKIKNLNYENYMQKMSTEVDGLYSYEHYSYYFYNILKTNKVAIELNSISIWFNEYSDFYKLYFSLLNLKYNNLNIAYFVCITDNNHKREDFKLNHESYNILSNLNDTSNRYFRIKNNNETYNSKMHDPMHMNRVQNSFKIIFKNIPNSLYEKLKTTDSNEYLELKDIINLCLTPMHIYINKNTKNYYTQISSTNINQIQNLYKNKQSFLESRKTFGYWGSLYNAQMGFGARPYEYYHWILWLIKNNIVNYYSLTNLNLDNNNINKLKLILDYTSNSPTNL